MCGTQEKEKFRRQWHLANQTRRWRPQEFTARKQIRAVSTHDFSVGVGLGNGQRHVLRPILEPSVNKVDTVVALLSVTNVRVATRRVLSNDSPLGNKSVPTFNASMLI